MGNIFKRKKSKVDPEFISDRSKKIREKDIERVVNASDHIQNKVKKNPKLKELLSETTELLSVIKDYWNKEYTEMPWYALSAITFTLLYILNPLDLSPDYIPFLGLVDDASVLTLAISMVKKDLKKYNEWKLSRPNKTDNH